MDRYDNKKLSKENKITGLLYAVRRGIYAIAYTTHGMPILIGYVLLCFGVIAFYNDAIMEFFASNGHTIKLHPDFVLKMEIVVMALLLTLLLICIGQPIFNAMFMRNCKKVGLINRNGETPIVSRCKTSPNYYGGRILEIMANGIPYSDFMDLKGHLGYVFSATVADIWQGKSPRYVCTVWVYEGYYYQRVSPTLGKKKLTDIDELAIRELLAKIKEDGYAYSSQVKVKKLLSQMLEAAVDNNYAKVNPVKKIKLGKDDTNKPIHALTQEEQKIFMQLSQGKFYHNAYMLQLFTGIRPGELFALKTSDINFEDKTISVERTLLYKKGIGQKCGYRFHEPKTDASKRIIPMSNECEKILRQQIELKSGLQNEYPQQDEDFKDLLFTTSTNTPLNTSAYNSSIKLLTNRIRKNGYEIKHFTGHDLRHTFATRCYESGITPKTIQIYMGHSSLQMTMDIYTHVFKDHKSKEIFKLDELNLSIMPV